MTIAAKIVARLRELAEVYRRVTPGERWTRHDEDQDLQLCQAGVPRRVGRCCAHASGNISPYRARISRAKRTLSTTR